MLDDAFAKVSPDSNAPPRQVMGVNVHWRFTQDAQEGEGLGRRRRPSKKRDIWGARSPFQSVASQPSKTHHPIPSVERSEPTASGVSAPAGSSFTGRKSTAQKAPPVRMIGPPSRWNRWHGREEWPPTVTRVSFRFRWAGGVVGNENLSFPGKRPTFFGSFEKKLFPGFFRRVFHCVVCVFFWFEFHVLGSPCVAMAFCVFLAPIVFRAYVFGYTYERAYHLAMDY